MICKDSHLEFPLPLYAQAILPIKKVLPFFSLEVWAGLVWQNVAGVMLWQLQTLRRGSFWATIEGRKSRLSCWRGGHMLAVGACRFCRLQPAPSRTWLWGPRILQPQVSLAHTMWDRDEHSSLSSAVNITSIKLQANKKIDMISHWLLGQFVAEQEITETGFLYFPNLPSFLRSDYLFVQVRLWFCFAEGTASWWGFGLWW